MIHPKPAAPPIPASPEPQKSLGIRPSCLPWSRFHGAEGFSWMQLSESSPCFAVSQLPVFISFLPFLYLYRAKSAPSHRICVCRYPPGTSRLPLNRSQHHALLKIPLHEGIDQHDRDDRHHGDGVLDDLRVEGRRRHTPACLHGVGQVGGSV